jgi:hypothetical protein
MFYKCHHFLNVDAFFEDPQLEFNYLSIHNESDTHQYSGYKLMLSDISVSAEFGI